ncbi:MAG TPA: carbohydrate ABC transporter permease [Ktedonobacteraceae bacterium]|nr:carbohydrate ABC transporter permease [Ktedonobacteraceae bacterium]
MYATLETAKARSKQGLSPWMIVGRVLLYLVLMAGALIMLSPFAYMLSMSFNPNGYTLPSPGDVIPAHPTLNNYISAWTDANFGQAFFNSVIVACSATALTVLLSASLAFAFARYDFPGRNILFYGMLATMTVPGIVLIIPQFVLASRLGLVNNRLGLILVYAAGMAFGVYMLRGFFEEIPQELFDAAAIDGSGIFRTFWSIALPLARPALAAVIIFSFAANWEEFTWAIVSTNDSSLYTLPVAIQQYYSAHGPAWGVIFAGSVLAMLPEVLVFLIFQRHFISGIRAGGVRG